MNKRDKKYIAVLITLLLCIGIPSTALAGSYYDTLGTNTALGSPLLDENFQSDDWDPWELVTFGVFLSNFVNPFIDDYESAFSTASTYGSKGAGLKALQFGSGNDPANNQVLTSLLNHAISMQRDTRFTKPLYYKMKYGYNDATWYAESPEEQATVRKLFIWTTSTKYDKMNGSINNALVGGNEVKGNFLSDIGNGITRLFNTVTQGTSLILTTDELDTGFILADPIANFDAGTISTNNYELASSQVSLLPEFYISSDLNNNPVIMLDYYDGWDIQIMTAWLSKVFNGAYKDQITEQVFKDFLDCPLYTDTYGNIVALKDGKLYMILPAAANQHITQNPQYNMLQSVLFGTEYINDSNDTIIDNVYPTEEMTGTSAFSGGDLGKGKTAVLYDSSSFLMQQIYDKAKSTFNSDTLTYEINQDVGINYGEVIADIMNADINKPQSTKSGFRVEVIKAEEISNFSRVQSMGLACNVLSIQHPIETTVPLLNYIKVRGMTTPLFGEPLVMGTTKDNLALKRYPNYYYGAVTKNTEKWLAEEQKIRTAKTMEDTVYTLITGTTNTDSLISTTFQKFLLGQVGKTIEKDNSARYLENSTLSSLKRDGYKLTNNKQISEKAEDMLDRVVKIYTSSSVLKQVSDILSVREGTDFALYSPYIYITYLEWYGIIGDGEHKFNEAIYTGSDTGSGIFSFDIEKATEGLFKSPEEKKKDILDYTYMLLNPDAGREYRTEIAMNNLSNFIYKSYQNIVYGGSINYYQSSTLSNRYGNGFLKIDSYSDNFMTGWFMEKYTEYAVIIIAVLSVLIILLGIIKGKKLIWYLASFILVINIVILLPAIGEIVPYVADSSVQSLFEDKMSYWAISEGVTNATIEKRIANEYKYTERQVAEYNIASEEAEQVLNLVKTLNINYLDRALMLKLDISKKVTETQLNSYDEVQRLQSARWLLPILLRQFTANNGSANYIFVPLADVFDNLSNMYWEYKPSDMLTVRTLASNNGSSGTIYDYVYSVDYIRDSMYGGYIDTSINIDNQVNNLMVLPDEYKDLVRTGADSWEHKTARISTPHTCFYYLYLSDTGGIPEKNIGATWKQYEDANAQLYKDDFKSRTRYMEMVAGKYDYSNPDSVVPDYGFLWNTENPMHYMYETIKDTFESGITLGTLAGELQGEYVKSKLTGEEVRKSFMHYADTGKIKDILDLEEMFTNMIPYMYSMQVLAGGIDGTSGALENEKIEFYTIYKNNNKSWLFRSNWVTKLMESYELTQKTTVKLPNGNTIDIENPMLPSNYPVERPMIFSEAQMYALGLNESELTLPELKILKVNKAVEKKWTLLLNYVNIPGMTKEVLYRQMALEAVIEFNKEFTSSNTLNPSAAMYPLGMDLRNISFDSVMKMLMLNNTKDTRYIYGDTMLRVIENNDIISAVLMLIGAFLCSNVIPFVRNILLGLLFYLGIFALLTHILSSNKMKVKITTAFLLNNIVFLVMNMLYYLSFSLMIKLTYTDNVLSINNVVVNVGNPVWIFIIIITVSVLFILGSWKLIKFTIINYRDMGFEAYASIAGLMAGKIADGVHNLGDKLSDRMNGEQVQKSGGLGGSIGVTTEGGRVLKVEKDDIEILQDNNILNIYADDSGYFSEDITDNTEGLTKQDIDAEIQKGKEANNE